MKDMYEGEVQDVFSGDDIIVLVDLGIEELFKRVRVRLHGVDTPNGLGASKDSEAGKVRSYVRQLCKSKRVRLEIVSKNVSSWVCKVVILTETGDFDLNADLAKQGYQYKREKA